MRCQCVYLLQYLAADEGDANTEGKSEKKLWRKSIPNHPRKSIEGKEKTYKKQQQQQNTTTATALSAFFEHLHEQNAMLAGRLSNHLLLIRQLITIAIDHP